MGRDVRRVMESVCMQVVGNFSECNFLQSSGLQNHVNDSYAYIKENKINKDKENSKMEYKQKHN